MGSSNIPLIQCSREGGKRGWECGMSKSWKSSPFPFPFSRLGVISFPTPSQFSRLEVPSIPIPIPNISSLLLRYKIIPIKSFQHRNSGIFFLPFFFLLVRSTKQIQSVIHANQEHRNHSDLPIVQFLSLPPWSLLDFPALNKNNPTNSK